MRDLSRRLGNLAVTGRAKVVPVTPIRKVTPCLERARLKHATMLTNPKRTKKAIQELSRVFNKLASELTADLNEAIREIESLKREIRTLKSKGTRTSTSRKNTTRRKTTSRGASHPRTSTHPTSTTTSTSSPSTSHHASPETTKPNEEAGYVFPQEPYNPPSPPEPSIPGNN